MRSPESQATSRQRSPSCAAAKDGASNIQECAPRAALACRLSLAKRAVLAQEVIKLFGGCPVVWNDPLQAYAHLQRNTVDLIFLDVHMPEMTGLELSGKIRDLERDSGQRRTPIVALTASAMPQEVDACLQHGMDDVVLKPFALEALKTMLDRWCHEDGSPPQ